MRCFECNVEITNDNLGYHDMDGTYCKKCAGIRETMWVCDHCLMAIESREGNQATMRHWVDEDDENESYCDWCEESGFDTLYELI